MAEQLVRSRGYWKERAFRTQGKRTHHPDNHIFVSVSLWETQWLVVMLELLPDNSVLERLPPPQTGPAWVDYRDPDDIFCGDSELLGCCRDPYFLDLANVLEKLF